MSTDAALVARELRDREPIVHRPEHGTSRSDFEAMTVIDYWEVGASGTIYDRQTCLDELEQRYADPTYDPIAGLEVSDFSVREAGDESGWRPTDSDKRSGTHAASPYGGGRERPGSSSITRARVIPPGS